MTLRRAYAPDQNGDWAWQTLDDPDDDDGGGGGGSRPFIEDTETGLVVNRASGFVSEWEEFDLEQPGVGYAKATITAADGDGLVWATDIAPQLEIEVSADGTTWVLTYGTGATGDHATSAHSLDLSASNTADPVGDSLAYWATTPRHIRFRALLVDLEEGEFVGAENPTFTFTLDYTAG